MSAVRLDDSAADALLAVEVGLLRGLAEIWIVIARLVVAGGSWAFAAGLARLRTLL